MREEEDVVTYFLSSYVLRVEWTSFFDVEVVGLNR